MALQLRRHPQPHLLAERSPRRRLHPTLMRDTREWAAPGTSTIRMAVLRRRESWKPTIRHTRSVLR